MSNENMRKELAKAILHRINSFSLAGKPAEKVAKNMLIGASQLALIEDNRELGQFLHTSFTDVVEQGLKLVYRWADVPVPVAAVKEAA